MSVLSRNDDKDIINNFKCNAKTHSQMGQKKFIPLYSQHIHFPVTWAGWLVTSIYQHFTSEQSKGKQDFVAMNQKSIQKATSPIERDFYKLLNSANFGIDSRNRNFEPNYDEICEIAYIKKFDSKFDNEKYRVFPI